MKQANLGLELSTKKTRKREFLEEMNRVVRKIVQRARAVAHASEHWSPA